MLPPKTLLEQGVRHLSRTIQSESRPQPYFPTAPQIDAEIGAVKAFRLSGPLTTWTTRYSAFGPRPEFLWKWCRYGAEVITLPCVRPQLRAELCDTKTLGILLAVLLDDVADQGGNPQLLEELLLLSDNRAPQLSGFDADERRYLQFAGELQHELAERTRSLPHFAEFASLLRFDYLQLANAMRYSHLLQASPYLLNSTEHDLYTPHNMHIMACLTFDLMGSDTFDRAELGKMREVAWHAQWMGRIGNLVTTWERELQEKDFSSGVYARAVKHGDVTVDQLLAGNHTTIEAAIRRGRHEGAYLEQWQEHREFLLSPNQRLKSFSMEQFAQGFERLLCLHLGSRGLK